MSTNTMYSQDLFIGLKKIHKSFKALTLTPRVYGYGSLTDNISAYLDEHLQPFVLN